MRICRFDRNRIGLVVGGQIRDVTAVLSQLPAQRYPFPTHDVFIDALPGLKEALEREAASASPIDLDSVALLSPIANPGKLVAAPVNYASHIAEATADAATFPKEQLRRIQETGLFLKASSSMCGASEGIRLALPDRRTDHEIELAVVIGKTASKVASSDAMSHVAGYCIGLDITLRGTEERSIRKSCDTYSVLGPWLTTPDEIADVGQLDLDLSVNGEPRQRANTRDLVLSVPQLIVFASSFYTLHPGDVIFTGTPSGVGLIRSGDTVNATITGLGQLVVKVS
ncbi:2-keto-4-pentenoate hydratase/2-oxohepta-3-ene-1,7-dioic acid hydratase in catechol pathway [Povalibacter uvarum]|uniref:2-keto-4-pentenoate hydratase/2-oxohepta-3-ene-1,7-dioic acid hydratase in catechol pathway n=1 Tax=Povalibacter uvarum TaxID=732238 RepID=A0A841HKU0_9GAMM|nr:fumarylacetoacetate hydrolase family protein [Povalibacter uvarum]MBB6093821.1 2-keto-4-pentenoate hydratase/2-oxohepta-3-ene-1,7-dioic acid hydratase in catechol pathway [Povalibacter uvarum]